MALTLLDTMVILLSVDVSPQCNFTYDVLTSENRLHNLLLDLGDFTWLVLTIFSRGPGASDFLKTSPR
jgi:hypothetical protein